MQATFVNGIVVILVKIFKTNGFYTRKYLITRYPKYNQNQLTRTVVLEVFSTVTLKY